jgi:HD-like signal output (HDOD) protein
VAESILEELWFGDEDPDRPRAQAEQSFAAEVARIQGLRPFPVAAEKLIRVLSNPDFKKTDVVAVMESDPSLAARTLAVANSPLFRGQSACRTIEQALVRLGARNLRDVAIGVSAMSMFADAKGIGQVFRDHSVGVGATVRMLAGLAFPRESSTLFLAGLLHDVGKLLLLQTGELAYDDAETTGDDGHLLERTRLGYDHAVLGGHVMKLWRIPDPIAKVVAWHHQPARALGEGGDVGLMVALLRAADRIDHALQEGRELDADLTRNIGEDASWSYADLSVGDLRELWPAVIEARRETLGALRA